MNPPIPTSVLSIDIGKKRIGLAGCDPLGLTICRLPALHRKTFNEDLTAIKSYCTNRQVKGILIGIPLDKDGSLTIQAKYCANYGTKLVKALNLPMAWINEHSSSWAAGEIYNLHNDRSGKLDSAAAELLLDQWLREGPDLKPVHMPS